MSVVAGAPFVDMPSAVRTSGLPSCSAPKMIALSLYFSLMPSRVDMIAADVAAGAAETAAHCETTALSVHPCSAQKHAANTSLEVKVVSERAIHSSRCVSDHTCAETDTSRLTEVLTPLPDWASVTTGYVSAVDEDNEAKLEVIPESREAQCARRST
jgi:hypothetical protein